ncbi:hypothetical protein LZZ85_03245 [Terrimonas sp. NA20]|uniref:Secretion system C-terminal sorting domain-containing protein n=1 Tax=Terrimonas ginsenosidimutans TaxID=2908004 RepID=A0ABS9KLT5_9BACT|nr:hypothetical protein [Terrimonas ginsenosidimutans]MCG2613274.1 hypothetical protein [Terrimonas ginsenosidimutans]
MISFTQTLTAALIGFLPVNAGVQNATEPMQLSAFQVGNTVRLTWSGSIAGSNYYVIQKKIDQRYYTIDSLKLSAQDQHTLTYTEAYASAGVNKYRIKKIGCNRAEQFSNEYAISFTHQSRLTLSASPGSLKVTAFHCPGGEQDNIIVLNADHKKVVSIRVKPQKAFTIVDFAGLSSGLYYIGWKSGDNFTYQLYIVE